MKRRLVSLVLAATAMGLGLNSGMPANAAPASRWGTCGSHLSFTKSIGYLHMTVGNTTDIATTAPTVHIWIADRDLGSRQIALTGGETNFYIGSSSTAWIGAEIIGESRSVLCSDTYYL